MDMDNYRWIIENNIEAWIAGETYLVLRGNRLRDKLLRVARSWRIPAVRRWRACTHRRTSSTLATPCRALGIIDAVEETGGVGITTREAKESNMTENRKTGAVDGSANRHHAVTSGSCIARSAGR